MRRRRGPQRALRSSPCHLLKYNFRGGAQVRADELKALSALGVVKSYQKGTVIVAEGDETDAFYVILAGRVKVFVSDEDGNEAVLGTQGPGDYFGEMVLDGGPRSASVMTLEPARFAVVSRDKFRDF